MSDQKLRQKALRLKSRLNKELKQLALNEGIPEKYLKHVGVSLCNWADHFVELKFSAYETSWQVYHWDSQRYSSGRTKNQLMDYMRQDFKQWKAILDTPKNVFDIFTGRKISA